MKLQEWKEKSKYLNKINDLISFTTGVPDKKIVAQYLLMVKTAVRRIARVKKEAVLNYSSPNGCFDLKRNVCELLEQDNINCNADEILVTTGSQQAIKILSEVLLKPGDVVMIKMPTYIGIEKPLKDRGIIIKNFSEEGIKKYHPKVVYLIPDFANPTGLSMSLSERKKMVSLAKEYGFWIIEDQTYRPLFFDKKKLLPSIASLYKKTIVIGTVSKFIVPGLRVGWMVVKNKELLDDLTLMKESSDLSTSNFDQEIVSELLAKVIKNRKILNKERSWYLKKMNLLVDCLNSELSDYFEWEVPEGGFYIWLRPKNKLDINEYWKRCLKRGVAFSPGSLFYFNHKKSNEIRLSIGEVDMNSILLGVMRLKRALLD